MKHGFYPPNAFSDTAEWDNRTCEWYSTHLVAMQEPSLWVLSEDHLAHAYRFLWLRTFHQPVLIRLVINEGGTGQLTAKVTDGRGGYEPGRLIFDEKTGLPTEAVSDFLTTLASLRFWDQPSRDGGTGLDGAQWVLEGVQNSQYHLLDRFLPPEGAFREAALMLTGLAQVTVQEVY